MRNNRFTTWERNVGKIWVGGGIGLDAGNMGGGESVVRIASEQGRCGFMAHTLVNEPNPSVLLELMCDL